MEEKKNTPDAKEKLAKWYEEFWADIGRPEKKSEQTEQISRAKSDLDSDPKQAA